MPPWSYWLAGAGLAASFASNSQRSMNYGRSRVIFPPRPRGVKRQRYSTSINSVGFKRRALARVTPRASRIARLGNSYSRSSKRYSLRRKRPYRSSYRGNYRSRSSASLISRLSAPDAFILSLTSTCASAINQCSYAQLLSADTGTPIAGMPCVTQLSSYATAGITGTTAKFVMSSCRYEYRYANLGSSVANFTVYDLCVRRDLVSGQSPVSLLTAGFSDTSISGGQNPLLTPFQSPRFCEFFKICRIRRYKLEPGQVVNVLYSSSRPRIFHKEQVLNDTSPLWVGQRTWLFRVEGQTADDTTTNTIVGLSGAKVSIYCKVHYTFRRVNDYATTTYTGNSSASLAAAQYINEETEQKQNDLFA